MHASSAAFSSSAGSYVGHLADNVATHWLTGTAYPCVSVFIPVYLSGAGPSRIFSEGGAKYDDRSPWWIHEKLARVVQLDYLKRAPPLKNEIRKLQISFIKEANALRQQTMKHSKSEQKSLREFTDRCSKTVYDAIPKWISNSAGIGSNDMAPLSYRNYWNKLNTKANLRL
jgi:dipeptidase